jgi:hypothetical protein
MKRTPLISSRGSFSRRTCVEAILLSAAGLIGPGIAHATDISWNRAAGNTGNLGDGANWVGAVAPGSGDVGFINNGGVASSSSPYVGTISNLRLGAGLTDTGTLVMSTGGSLEVGGGFVGDLSIEEVAKAIGKRPGAVKALQRRGLAAVKREIGRRRGVPL